MLIGEISKKSGLSKDTLRHYESLGLIHSKPKQAGSRVYRDYDDDTFERLSLVAFAKRLHAGLRETAELMNRAMSDTITREERADIMAKKIREIDAKIEDLRNARAELVELFARPDKEYVDARLKELGLWLE